MYYKLNILGVLCDKTKNVKRFLSSANLCSNNSITTGHAQYKKVAALSNTFKKGDSRENASLFILSHFKVLLSIKYHVMKIFHYPSPPVPLAL